MKNNFIVDKINKHDLKIKILLLIVTVLFSWNDFIILALVVFIGAIIYDLYLYKTYHEYILLVSPDKMQNYQDFIKKYFKYILLASILSTIMNIIGLSHIAGTTLIYIYLGIIFNYFAELIILNRSKLNIIRTFIVIIIMTIFSQTIARFYWLYSYGTLWHILNLTNQAVIFAFAYLILIFNYCYLNYKFKFNKYIKHLEKKHILILATIVGWVCAINFQLTFYISVIGTPIYLLVITDVMKYFSKILWSTKGIIFNLSIISAMTIALVQIASKVGTNIAVILVSALVAVIYSLFDFSITKYLVRSFRVWL